MHIQELVNGLRELRTENANLRHRNEELQRQMEAKIIKEQEMASFTEAINVTLTRNLAPLYEALKPMSRVDESPPLSARLEEIKNTDSPPPYETVTASRMQISQTAPSGSQYLRSSTTGSSAITSPPMWSPYASVSWSPRSSVGVMSKSLDSLRFDTNPKGGVVIRVQYPLNL